MRSIRFAIHFFSLLSLFALLTTGPASAQAPESEQWVVYEGGDGPGEGQHIVFVSGDEEYRSEEALPMLAKILAVRHGFKCTVLFPVEPETGEINPNYQKNIPGLHTLETADLMVLFTRFRNLPDEQMKYIVDYTNSGKPIMGLRTATHAFRYPEDRESPYAKYSFDSQEEGFEGGYGQQVFGSTWAFHQGEHHEETTRGLINGLMQDHPILQGVQDIWAMTDVYGLNDIKGSEQVLVFGQSLKGMEPTAEPNLEKSIMPVAWIKNYTGETGNTARVFNTTTGASVDLENRGLRRLLVNAAYWLVGLSEEIPAESDVAIVGDYAPTYYGFDEYQQGMEPSDFVLDR